MEEKKITSATLAEAQTWIGRSCTCYESNGKVETSAVITSAVLGHSAVAVSGDGMFWWLSSGDYIVLEPEALTLKSLRAQRAELDEQIEDLERVAARTEGLPEGWRWPAPDKRRHAVARTDDGRMVGCVDASCAYPDACSPRDLMVVSTSEARVHISFAAVAAVVDAYRENNPGA